MGIRINTNIFAQNAQRNLAQNQLLLGKTLERLSTGLRINHAADDAAGITLAENLNTQVRGLQQGIFNAQSGIDLVQTAEGAIGEMTTLTQRIRELVLQSGNGTLTNSDKLAIQDEVDQLVEEVDRIARTTDFNGRKLLDGSIAPSQATQKSEFNVIKIDRVGDATATVPDIVDFFKKVDLSGVVGVTATLDINDLSNSPSSTPLHLGIDFRIERDLTMDPDVNFAVAINVLDEGVDTPSNFYGPGTEAIYGAGCPVLTLDDPTNPVITFAMGTNGTLNYYEMAVNKVTQADIGKSAAFEFTTSVLPVTTDQSLQLQIGANAGQTLKLGIEDLTAHSLGLEALTINAKGLSAVKPDVVYDKATITNIVNGMQVNNNLITVDQALDKLNRARSRLGATQNRLNSSINTMSITRENTLQALSRVRDADIAEETANLTRHQILVQAGTAILSQANISQQNILNLL